MTDAQRLRDIRKRVKEAKERSSPDSQLLDELLHEIESNVNGNVAHKEYSNGTESSFRRRS